METAKAAGTPRPARRGSGGGRRRRPRWQWTGTAVDGNSNGSWYSQASPTRWRRWMATAPSVAVVDGDDDSDTATTSSSPSVDGGMGGRDGMKGNAPISVDEATLMARRWSRSWPPASFSGMGRRKKRQGHFCPGWHIGEDIMVEDEVRIQREILEDIEKVK